MIVAVGVSYREVPIEVRERLALDAEAVVTLARSLVGEKSVIEAICLSTCNRVEIYACAKEASSEAMARAAETAADALEAIALRNGLPGIRAHLKTRHGIEAMRHLCRVASSLDSLVLGEPQILGQVKQALDVAREAGTVGRYLERATSRALHVAKRVRTETAVGAGQVSISSVAIDLARQIFGELRGRAALLVGAGEMAETAARLLGKAGATLCVVNRSPERAQSLAESLGGTARPWSELAAAIAGADVVIASTAARAFVITQAMVAQAMRVRRGRSLFFIDIAVPRDVEPTTNDLDNVYVYDIDNLSQTVTESMSERRSEAERAETLVAREAEAFESWIQSQRLNRIIVALRSKVRTAIAAEVDKTLSGRLRHLSLEDRAAFDTMVEAATSKVLHAPLTRLKSVAADPHSSTLASALHELFDLPDSDDAVDAPADSAPTVQSVRMTAAPAALQQSAVPAALQQSAVPAALQQSAVPAALQQSTAPAALQQSTVPTALQQTETSSSEVRHLAKARATRERVPR